MITHPFRLIIAFALGMVAITLVISAAHAASMLRASVTVDRDVVLAGDLVSDAGALAAQPVFLAPEPGHVGTLTTEEVLAALQAAGLSRTVATGGLEQITVARAGRVISTGAIEAELRLALADRSRTPSPENIEIEFDQPPVLSVAAPDSAVLTVSNINWNQRSGRFDAMVTLSDVARTYSETGISGRAVDAVEIVVAARALPRQTRLSANDLAMMRVPRAALPAGALTDMSEAVGMASRRALRLDEPVRLSDIEKPVLVERGSLVTIIHTMPGMTLTVRGQALQAGAEGAAIGVVNEQSKRVVQGTVTGPGQVTVSPVRTTLMSAR